MIAKQYGVSWYGDENVLKLVLKVSNSVNLNITDLYTLKGWLMIYELSQLKLLSLLLVSGK